MSFGEGGPVATACSHCAQGTIGTDGRCESCGHMARSARDHNELDLRLVAGVTDLGRRHHRNEDAFAIAVADAGGNPVPIAVVCDGVSGSDRGDEASQAGVEAAMAVLLPAVQAGAAAADASRQAVQAAQAAVAALNEQRQSVAGDAPSATYISAVITAEAVTVCWLGDSRAYWLPAGQALDARQLTTDDSLATEMVSAGMLSEEAALDSPHAHVVTGWLGADLSTTEPHLAAFEPAGPGAVLVCSDGLWNYLPDAAKLAERALPSARTDPLAVARELVEFAISSGGRDNVTVVLAPFPPDAESQPGPREPDADPPTQPIPAERG
jgi:serine/threonine protein phosphatase PrpC